MDYSLVESQHIVLVPLLAYVQGSLAVPYSWDVHAESQKDLSMIVNYFVFVVIKLLVWFDKLM